MQVCPAPCTLACRVNQNSVRRSHDPHQLPLGHHRAAANTRPLGNMLHGRGGSTRIRRQDRTERARPLPGLFIHSQVILTALVLLPTDDLTQFLVG